MSDKLREALEIIRQLRSSLDYWLPEKIYRSPQTIEFIKRVDIQIEALANPQPTAPVVNLPSINELDRWLWLNVVKWKSETDCRLAAESLNTMLINRLAKPAEIDLSGLRITQWGGVDDVKLFLESQGYKVKIGEKNENS